MRKKIALKIVFLLLAYFTSAQKNINLEFDKAGVLLKGMPSVVTPDDTIIIKIPFDKTLFQVQLDSVKLRVLKAIIAWNNPTFREKMQNYFEITRITTFRRELQYFYDCINRPVNDLLTSLSGCNNNLIYLPSPVSFINSLKAQYKALAKCKNDDCAKALHLTGPTLACENWCFTAECIVAGEDINIEVYKLDPIKNFVIDWYNNKLLLFNHDDWLVATQSLDSSEFRLRSYLKFLADTTNRITDTCAANRILQNLNYVWQASPKYRFVNTNYNNLKQWMLSFSWLNEGDLQINPFSFTNAQFYEQKDSNKYKPDPDYQIADSIINAVIKSKRKLDNKSYNELITSIAKKDSLQASTRGEKFNNSAFKIWQKAIAERNNQMLNQLQLTGVFLNKVKEPVFIIAGKTTKLDTLRVRNYYYNKQPDKKGFKYLLPDNERILFTVHNVPKDNSIANEEKIEKYNEQPQIVKEGLAFTDSVSTLFSMLSPFSGVAKTISESFYNIRIPRRGGQDESFQDSASRSRRECAENLRQKIAQNNDTLLIHRFIDSLKVVSQTPPLALNTNMTELPLYRTEIITPDVGESPYKYKYKLTAVIDTTTPKKAIAVIDSSYYNVGKRRSIEFGAGFVYSITSVRQVNVDTSGGKFNVTNDEDRVRLVLGLKFHFGKIFWGDNRFFIQKKKGQPMPSIVPGRFYGFVGVAIPKPLNNLYMGAGVDIIPGLSITGGLQLYKTKKYAINNNQILGQSFVYKPALFAGITTDPTLLAALLKTIIKP